MEFTKDRFLRLILTISMTIVLSVVMNIPVLIQAFTKYPNDRIESALVGEKTYEIFGFAPHWTLNRLDNVDFDTLTTLAYFSIPVNGDGTFDKNDPGYQKFESEKANALFNKAHAHGTKVVLTITQMNNHDIKDFLDNENAQNKAITETVKLVKSRGLDGINIDFEYVGNPGQEYRDKFSKFVERTSQKLHQALPSSHLSVSVYASSVKHPKIYDIARLSKISDSIFMMAYDFATTASDEVMPTAPLYGHKEKKYWYDISTAVEDFLKVMPAEKLILGLPWYGYNYPVAEPGVRVARYKGYYYYYWWKRRKYTAFQSIPANAQTYASAWKHINGEKEGWDDYGKVGWKAYREGGIWRMIFLDDERSLKLKYQFAKQNNLLGVGMWALGFDNGRRELWQLLAREFGQKLAYSN